MRWTFFVLDFDGTYDNEYEDELGVEPLVFAILEKDVAHVHQIAKEAHEIFHDNLDDLCIGDYLFRGNDVSVLGLEDERYYMAQYRKVDVNNVDEFLQK